MNWRVRCLSDDLPAVPAVFPRQLHNYVNHRGKENSKSKIEWRQTAPTSKVSLQLWFTQTPYSLAKTGPTAKMWQPAQPGRIVLGSCPADSACACKGENLTFSGKSCAFG